jgi:phenylalanyl-tRNA synthetase alpha chain
VDERTRGGVTTGMTPRLEDRLSELSSLKEDALARIAGAATLEELRSAEASVLGKRSPLAGLARGMAALGPDERRALGRAINQERSQLQGALGARRQALEEAQRRERLEADRLDLTEVIGQRPVGHLNLVTKTQTELEDVFVGMGFTVAEGPEVETDWYSFEALNIPPGHPARSMFDTFYLKLGPPESTLLRPHTSPVQVRVMESRPPPVYSVMPGRCYRRDTPDARHTPTFHQIEGLVVDRGISFAHLAGTIEAFTTAYFGPTIHSRLRPSYFPFTEPSAEYEVTCPICEGAGCRTCSEVGWIELGGCGMVDPAVFEKVGVDPEEWSGFAFGFGIDRCAQVRHSLSDMRVLLDNDMRFLAQF